MKAYCSKLDTGGVCRKLKWFLIAAVFMSVISGIGAAIGTSGADSTDAAGIAPGGADYGYSDYAEPIHVAAPQFSHEAGFYDEPFYLSLEAGAGDGIYYTLDGSEPDENSAKYEAPVYIEDASYKKNVYSALTDISTGQVTAPKVILHKCTVLRAVAIDANGNKSDVISNSYFINFQNLDTLNGISALSVIVDPKDMFDHDDGIYMLGKRYRDWTTFGDYSPSASFDRVQANYTQDGMDSEIESCVQWFDDSGNRLLSQNVGLRVDGKTSRNDPQKSIKLYAREQYDQNTVLDCQFWPDSPKVSAIDVRNDGRGGCTYFLDSFLHSLLNGHSDKNRKATPCVMFVNGEYWGIYIIREHQDANYIANRYGVDPDDVVIVKDEEITEGDADDIKLYDDMINTVLSMTCSETEDYEYVESIIDIDSYNEYIACGVYFRNTDWLTQSNKNESLWRVRDVGQKPYEDGKWRWVYQDLDSSCYIGKLDLNPIDLVIRQDIFASLWTNSDYRNRFLTCVMDFANIDCAQSRVNAILDQYAEFYRPHVEEAYQRYSLDYTLKAYDDRIEYLKDFFENRPESVADELISALQLDREAYTLNLKSNSAYACAYSVNSREVEPVKGNWSGMYFEGCPITVKANDVVGYVFKGWYEAGSLVTDSDEVTIELDKNRTLSAKYEPKLLILSIADDNRPHEFDGGIDISSGSRRYNGRIVSDDGVNISVGEDGMSVVLSSDETWQKDDGFTFTVSTVKRGDVSFNMTVEAASGYEGFWKASYSTDGDDYTDIESFLLKNGINDVAINMPTAIDDNECVYIRFSAINEHPATKRGLVIGETLMYAQEMDKSLAELKSCVAMCIRELGSELESYDLDSVNDLSQREIDNMVEAMYGELASRMVQNSMKTVADALGNAAALEGLGEYPCITVSGEISEKARDISVLIDGDLFTSSVYVYMWSPDGMALSNVIETAGGTVVIPADAGVFILLDRPIEQMRYRMTFRDDKIDDELIEAAFYGVEPSAYIWMDVRQLTDYQENMTISLPSNSAQYFNTVWAYSYQDGYILLRTSIAPEEGAYTVEPLPTGTYLLLPMNREDYKSESARVKELKKSIDNSSIGVENLKKLLNYAVVILALLIILIVVLCVVIRRQRKRRKRD